MHMHIKSHPTVSSGYLIISTIYTRSRIALYHSDTPAATNDPASHSHNLTHGPHHFSNSIGQGVTVGRLQVIFRHEAHFLGHIATDGQGLRQRLAVHHQDRYLGEGEACGEKGGRQLWGIIYLSIYLVYLLIIYFVLLFTYLFVFFYRYIIHLFVFLFLYLF